jgi:hypothetical protein
MIKKNRALFSHFFRNQKCIATAQISLGKVVSVCASSIGQGNVNKGVAHFFHVPSFVSNLLPLKILILQQLGC